MVGRLGPALELPAVTSVAKARHLRQRAFVKQLYYQSVLGPFRMKRAWAKRAVLDAVGLRHIG